MKNLHFLLLTCVSQGHINPTFHLSKLFLSYGARVTFATTVHGRTKIKNLPSLPGLSYASFSDGFDCGTPPNGDPEQAMSQFKRVGSQSLSHLIQTLSEEGNPVDFLIYGLLLPWAADVARDNSIPSAFLYTQSASVFAIYQHFFNSHDGLYKDCNNNNYIPPSSVNLPNLPSIAQQDLPSFLIPTNPYSSVIPYFQEHIQNLEKDSNPCVIINTFDALEPEVITKNITNVNLITVGPLIPLDNNPLGFDLFEASEGYIEWLESKSDRSVVYVSFGSIAVLQRKQMEEVLHGLVSSGFSFLWVIRGFEDDGFEEMIREVDGDGVGLIVKWCWQVEVLRHISVGCFVSHCGWNSTLESLLGGVPVVGVPQFSDQMTNAKMVEEVWGNGVRGRVNDDGVVEREEIRRCVEMVMGSDGEGIREKARQWRELALEAVGDDGTSETNVRALMQKLGA